MTYLTADVFAALATVVAAIIAGLISFVSLTLTKEQKTSEFRQAWIDGLRQDLAAYFAASRACTRAFEEMFALGPAYEGSPASLPKEKVATLRHQAAETHYRIKLRLNAEELEHIELLRLIRRASEEQNNQLQSGAYASAPVLAAMEIACDYARPLLKAEWRRVKLGEPQFRAVRNWVIPAVVVLCVAFAWLLLAAHK